VSRDPYVIRWDAQARVWRVFLTGEFARFVGEFASLAAAERYCLKGES
jgi:hypothetical protein